MSGYCYFIFTAILLFGFTVVLGTQYERLSTLDNFYPPEDVVPLEESSVKSVIDCARICSQHNGTCLSFFYLDSTSPVCQLHAALWNSSEPLDFMPNAKYYKEREAPFLLFQCPVTNLEYTSVTLSDGTLFTYRFDDTHVTQDAAFTLCAAEGSRLAQVVTQAKLDMIHAIRNECLGYNPVWIDGNNLAATDYFDLNQWETSTNISIPPSFWYPGQPNTQTTDHCMYLYLLDVDSKTLADALCSLSFSVLCER